MASVYKYSDHYFPPAPVVNVTLCAQNTIEVVGLIDSGADATIVPHIILNRIGARFARTSQMTGISGKPEAVALYIITVQIEHFTLPGIKAIASKATTEVIIGRDVLNHLIVTLDGIAGEIEVS